VATAIELKDVPNHAIIHPRDKTKIGELQI